MTMAMARTASLSLSSSASSSNNRSNSNSNSSNETTPVTPPPNERARLLNRCLDQLLHHNKPSSTANSNNDSNNESTPAAEIMEAAIRSLRDPSSGYDQRFGRPALRAYRSFVYPKKLPYNLQLQLQLQSTGNGSREEDDDDDGDDDNNDNNNNNGRPGTTSVNEDPIQLEAAAQRTANQIDFLIKRQTSKRMEAIRNHDPETLRNNDDDDDDDDDTSSSSSPSQRRRRRRRSNTVFPIALVLDNLRGSFNVGSIFRTAEACGVREILTCGITPHPNGSGAEKVAKSALGADMLVPSRHFATTRQALEALKGNHNNSNNSNSNSNSNSNDADENNHDHLVVALETTAASHLYTSFDFRPYDCRNHKNNSNNNNNNKKEDSSSSSSSNNNDKEDNNNQTRRYGGGIALVLGNEVTGVDAELFAHLLPTPDDNDNDSDSDNEQTEAGTKTITTKTNSKTGPVDVIVELPTYGQKNSLNVAAVAPVILYEIVRQWEEEQARHGTARHQTNERTNERR